MSENKSTNIYIYKNTGEKDNFSRQKFLNSLIRSGTNPETADKIADIIETKLYPGITTKKIYKIALKLLKQQTAGAAGKFVLKKAVMDLGPSGYPFEKFLGRLFKARGYKVNVDQTVQGKCVSHEIDVIARNDTEQIMVECKFHSNKGQKSDVKVPLYINSRFKDVEHTWIKDPDLAGLKFYGMVATNTRFTDDAKRFANCAGLKVISWDYPEGNSLREWIDESGYYPVTALHSLNKSEKKLLLEKDIVLCRELNDKKEVLKSLGFNDFKIKNVLKEAEDIIS